MKQCLILLLAIFVTGCMSNPRIEDLSSSNRAKAASLQIFQGATDRPHEIVGQVTGLSCNRNKYQVQNISDAEALQGIRINAARLGADAVINTFCQTNSDTDWRNNCWASIKCVGDAIRYTD